MFKWFLECKKMHKQVRFCGGILGGVGLGEVGKKVKIIKIRECAP